MRSSLFSLMDCSLSGQNNSFQTKETLPVTSLVGTGLPLHFHQTTASKWPVRRTRQPSTARPVSHRTECSATSHPLEPQIDLRLLS